MKQIYNNRITNRPPVMEERIQKIVSEFKAYVDADAARLRHSVSERNRVVTRLNAGDKTVYDHYRVLWLHETAMKLVSWIQEESVAFSAKYMSVGDTCTVADIVDMLKTTTAKFEKKM